MCNSYAVIHYNKLIPMNKLYMQPFYTEIYTNNEIYEGLKLARHLFQYVPKGHYQKNQC